jgi:hypothetical protein
MKKLSPLSPLTLLSFLSFLSLLAFSRVKGDKGDKGDNMSRGTTIVLLDPLGGGQMAGSPVAVKELRLT